MVCFRQFLRHRRTQRSQPVNWRQLPKIREISGCLRCRKSHFSCSVNPGFHCSGQMADSVCGIIWVSDLLVLPLWIEVHFIDGILNAQIPWRDPEACCCASSCEYPATSHSHWRGVDQHSVGHNQQPDQLYVKEMCCTAWGKWWSYQILTCSLTWHECAPLQGHNTKRNVAAPGKIRVLTVTC